NFLNNKFLPKGEKGLWLEPLKRPTSWIYLNRENLKELKLNQGEVESALAKWYNEQPGVAHAFTRTEMMNPRNEEAKEQHPFFASVKKSFHPDCSGDVMVILKPYHMFS